MVYIFILQNISSVLGLVGIFMVTMNLYYNITTLRYGFFKAVVIYFLKQLFKTFPFIELKYSFLRIESL